MVVDDDATLVDVVGRYLCRDGHQVECVHDGYAALRRIEEEPPDLVILDLMLPGISGLEVCRRLRQNWPIPIVMLTALGEETDKVVGFETGADDYVTKPFSPRELTMRGLHPRRAARPGVELVVRRHLHGHRACAPAAREARGRSDQAPPDRDRLGRRLPL